MQASPNITEDFKAAMRRMASTVSIVTCANASGLHGMTATAVTSVCADPSALLVCINASASFHRAIATADRFCVNLLDSSQADLSLAFSGRLSGAERFSVGRWRRGEHGEPYLDDAQANLFCLIDQRISYGTHTIIIGRVEHVLIADRVSPLLYQDGDYARAQRLTAA